jgi:hypothetical protein
MFDLPLDLSCSGGFPCIATIDVVYQGAGSLRRGTVSILGPQEIVGGMIKRGSPTQFPFGFNGASTPRSLDQDLEARRTLRLRAVAAVGPAPGFDTSETSQPIGAVELVLRHSNCVGSFTPHGATEATNATVVFGTPEDAGSGYKRVRLVLLEPNGFWLESPEGGAPDAAGQGPILDIAFNALTTPPVCSGVTPEQWFELEDLHVTGLDGQTLIDRRAASPDDSQSYFHIRLITGG